MISAQSITVAASWALLVVVNSLLCSNVEAFTGSSSSVSTSTGGTSHTQLLPSRHAHHAQQRTLVVSSVSVSNTHSDGKNKTKKSRKRRSSNQSKKRNRERDNDVYNNGADSSESYAGETWRLFGIEVHPDRLGHNAVSPMEGQLKNRNNAIVGVAPEKAYLTQPVLDALLSKLRLKGSYETQHIETMAATHNGGMESPVTVLPLELKDVRVVRRSLDARKKRRGGSDGGSGPRYNYVLDIDVSPTQVKRLRLKHRPGLMERLSNKSKDVDNTASKPKSIDEQNSDNADADANKPTVAIVGAGPAGLFCALTLARDGHCKPILFERGQPVESRGKDIGALMHRRSIDSESNFAFGEGGAGTWSDGKLTTRIGRNQGPVRSVLETLVEYGAPEKILVDGAPHLGTDNLVRLLRNMRRDLRKLGGEIRFGAKMTELHVEDGAVKGIDIEYTKAIERSFDDVEANQSYEGTETISADAVCLATGHSARDVYTQLHSSGIVLEPKGFATGFRVEHPQRLINQIQYGNEWGPSVVTGRVATDDSNRNFFNTLHGTGSNDDDGREGVFSHDGRLPVASYRLATDKAFDGVSNRGAYSFCMCPGGQIVPASTEPEEVCVNGMSFSKRDSIWANSALVVTVSPDDEVLKEYRKQHGVLAGIEFQRDMERAASVMGGGDLVVPVQRLTDFIAGRASTSAPPSSYRLGTKPSACHEIYPEQLVNALRDALVNHFEKQMPGYVCEEGLLHAVETRTSSPVRVSRDAESYQAIGCKRLFPAGEGAGFAGGIVSAAVDGMMVADAILGQFNFLESTKGSNEEEAAARGKKNKRRMSKKASVGFDY